MSRRARGVFVGMRPVGVICRVLGTLPIPGCYPHTLYVRCLLVVSLSQLLYGGYALYRILQEAHTSSLPQISLMKMTSLLLSSVAGAVSYVVSAVSLSRSFPAYLEGLREVDLRLSGLRPLPPPSSRFSLLLVLYFFLSITPVFLVHLTGFHPLEEFWKRALPWLILLSWFNLSAHTSELLFVNSCHLLFLRFRLLNGYLALYGDDPVALDYSPTRSGPRWSMKERVTTWKVELGRRIYTDLAGLFHLLNAIFELHLFVSLVTIFVKLVFDLYFSIYDYSGATEDALNLPGLLYGLTWVLIFALRFSLQILVASNTSFEASKTRRVVASITSRSLDADTKEELSMFLAQTSNQKLKFTAYGLFKLSKTFFTSALAAGATYLVILIQFRPR